MLPPLREVIARHGLSARKGLGQNFILDLNITRKIARAAGDLTGVNVIEVGPGPGGLTRAILETDIASLTAIELDPRAIAATSELLAHSNERLKIIEGDAQAFDYTAVPAPRAIIANLPYHIASQLLITWLRQANQFQFITIMLQKEMAQRLVAKPRTPAYGRLSVMCQWLADVKLLFDVPASAFVPPPKVTSSIIQLIPKNISPPLAGGDQGEGEIKNPPHPNPPPQGVREFNKPSFKQMEKTVALGFSQRRKMLKGILNAASYDGEKLLTDIGVAVTARAEELTVEQFVALSALL